MNYLFFGREADLNIGNGKTISAVKYAIGKACLEKRDIYSNIKLIGIPYTPLTPKSLATILEKENACVIADEIHAMIHKNHRIGEACKKHEQRGLCYLYAEFLRQVRKRKIDTYSTCQVFSDCHYQLRVVQQQLILCEKFHLVEGQMQKCEADICPPWHVHYIKNLNARTEDEMFFATKKYERCYNSEEVVSGWVSF